MSETGPAPPEPPRKAKDAGREDPRPEMSDEGTPPPPPLLLLPLLLLRLAERAGPDGCWCWCCWEDDDGDWPPDTVAAAEAAW
jgi:hypothetical protein